MTAVAAALGALLAGVAVALLPPSGILEDDVRQAAPAPTMTEAPTWSSVEPTTQPSRTSETAGLIPVHVDEIRIAIGALQGRQLGPTLFSFDDALGFRLGYGWSVYQNGTQIVGDQCSIEAVVTGPESFPPMRSAECTKAIGPPYLVGINSESLTKPGAYVIVVKDALSNVVATRTFTLLGPARQG